MNVDEARFYAYLKERGWREDTSPETENWILPAWRHEGTLATRPEDALLDEYEDFIWMEEQGFSPPAP